MYQSLHYNINIHYNYNAIIFEPPSQCMDTSDHFAVDKQVDTTTSDVSCLYPLSHVIIYVEFNSTVVKFIFVFSFPFGTPQIISIYSMVIY